MANTTFNTRIKLKYDTLANWTTNKAKVLLKGEIGLCYVPAVTNGTTTTAPTVLFKVGDGTTTWEKLPWGSSLAADVYDWAKAPNAPEDTDTQYKLEQDTTDGHILKFYSKSKNGNWGTPVEITIPDNDHNQTIKVGDVVFDANATITLIGDGVEISGDKTNKKITFKVSQATNATNAEKAAEADHATKADEATKADSATTATTADKVAQSLTLKAGSKSRTYNGSTATTFEVTAADLGLSGAMHFIGSATVPIADHSSTDPKIEGYVFSNAQKGDVILYSHLEFVWDGTQWEKLGDESSYVLKTLTINNHPLSDNIKLTANDVGALPDTTIIPTVNNATLIIQKNGTKVGDFSANQADDETINIEVPTKASDIGAATPSDITDKINELDSSLDAGTGKFIQKISIVNGKIDATTSKTLDYPTLDQINVNTSANYVIFDCGSSTSNI